MDFKKIFFGSVRRKIFFTFVITAIILTLFGTTNSYINNTSLMTEIIWNNLENTAYSRAAHINYFLEEQEDKIRIAATHSYLTNEKLQEMVNTQREFYEVFVLDSNGKVTASSDVSQIGKDKSSEDYFINGKNETYIKDAYFSEITKKNSIAVSTPYDEGVLVARIETTRLDNILQIKTGLGETGEAYLINSEGYMLTPSLFIENTFLKQKIETENAKKCLEDLAEHGNENEIEKHTEKIIIANNYRGVLVVGSHAYITRMNWCLLAEIDKEEALGGARNSIFFILLLNVITIITFAAIIAYIIAKTISAPISQLRNATIKMSEGKLSTRVNIETSDELAEMGETFNKAIAALEKTDTLRKELDRAKTEFISITSHELRSPMTPMKAHLQLLVKGHYGKLNKKQLGSLDIVLRNTNRLDNIIIDFLEVSRIEAARLKFNFVKTGLTPHINRLLKEMKVFMPEKNITIKSNIKELPVIEVDPDRIMQVLRNLINNAKKFSPENSTIFVEAKKNKNAIHFSVADEGIGIPKKYKQRIFEPFFQTEQTIYREHMGTGLGLTICKGIIESQNGKIWVENNKKKGSKFSFTVPFTPVKEAKSIKLLFSPQKNLEKQLNEMFKTILGPMGIHEFEKLIKEDKISEKELINYAKKLVKNKIITKEEEIVFRKQIKDIFM